MYILYRYVHVYLSISLCCNCLCSSASLYVLYSAAYPLTYLPCFLYISSNLSLKPFVTVSSSCRLVFPLDPSPSLSLCASVSSISSSGSLSVWFPVRGSVVIGSSCRRLRSSSRQSLIIRGGAAAVVILTGGAAVVVVLVVI